MDPLDELLSTTGRVPGITPRGLGNGRAALDVAIARAGTQPNSTMRQPGPRALRQAPGRWWGGPHGKTIIGVAGVAAAAAATTVLVLPPSLHPGTSGPTVPGAISKVTYTIRPAATNVTAAYVLNKAATLAGAQLANGWPNARYWHTEEQVTSLLCPGQVTIANDWVDRSGNGVGENTTTGPKSSDPMCESSADNGKPFRIINVAPLSAWIGEKQYTWSELADLPTDPAKLWPVVRADEQLPFTSDPSLSTSGQSHLFRSIWNLLTSEPVSAGLRTALYEVAAKIPGVTVAGSYTDSLGRTGTALHIGLWTMVVDTGNGQVLAMISGAPPVPQGCVRASASVNVRHVKCVVGGGDATVYISAGAANSAPIVPK